VRQRFAELHAERSRSLLNDLRSEGVDTLQLSTDAPYLPALQRFFKMRQGKRL
jgi:hypothetical protein